MLSRFDDYPVHQTPEPVAHPATTDRNAYGRYWFNGYSADGRFYFGVALGLYPHRGVMDAAFSLVHRGEQRSFFASRRAPEDLGELSVGPMRIEVLRPMHSLRVTLDDNESGLSCSMVFEATTACMEEERQVLHHGRRIVMDCTRFTQFGRWSGQVRVDGETIMLDPREALATRDRSWGIRRVGEPETGGAPPAPPQIYFAWSPIQWPTRCTHFGVFEDAQGRQLHGEGRALPRYAEPALVPGISDPALERMAGVAHSLRYLPGTRRAGGGTIHMLDGRGERHSIELTPLLCFQMRGLGYGHPAWGHGMWKGELAVGHERFACGSLPPLARENVHVQQLVHARMGDEQGIGILEQLCVGPHAPSGFTGLLDGAR